MIAILLLAVTSAALIAGTITDLKTREVPDWISYGLMSFGIAARLIYSVLHNEFSMLWYGLAGLGVMVAFGYLMYYTGQWGGGDSKLLMGIGAMIGVRLSADAMFFAFLANCLIVGAVYGMLYSTGLAFVHRKSFKSQLMRILHSPKILKMRAYIRWVSIAAFAAAVVFSNYFPAASLMIVVLLASAAATFYLLVAVKAVELSSMYKFVKPSVITEGDWIAKEYYFGKEYLCGPKDLGISRKQMKRLNVLYSQKKIGKIKVKYGIPFVPSFLIAFALAVIFGPWWMLL